MDQSIISRETMRQRGAKAFRDGRLRHSHGMNPGDAGLPDWLEGFNQAQLQDGHAFFRKQADVCLTAPAPVVHSDAEELTRSLVAMVRP